jgi:2',3'-cyclic-nucleotide 2'-phosphodiesterase (5'-nucleotidase family)
VLCAASASSAVRFSGTIDRDRSHRFSVQVTLCVPGDFLAPSCLGKLSRGQHMVEIFNCLGVDYVTFGNHEFGQKPLTPATLAGNIARSNFTWVRQFHGGGA